MHCVADRAVDVGVDDVLARALQPERRLAERLEARRLRGTSSDERRVGSPRSCPVHRSAYGSTAGSATYSVSQDAARARVEDRPVAGLAHRRTTRGSASPRTDDRLRGGSSAVPTRRRTRRRCASSFRRSTYRSWTSPLTFVTPHAWCAVVPSKIPGENGSATPRASYPGASRCSSNHDAGLQREQVRVVGEQRRRRWRCAPGRRPSRSSPALGPRERVEDRAGERSRRDGRRVGRQGRQQGPAASSPTRSGSTRAAARGPSCPRAPTRGTRTPRPSSPRRRGARARGRAARTRPAAPASRRSTRATPARNRRVHRAVGRRPSGRDASRRPGGGRSSGRTGRRRTCARRTPPTRRPVAARSASSSWKSRSPAGDEPLREPQVVERCGLDVGARPSRPDAP